MIMQLMSSRVTVITRGRSSLMTKADGDEEDLFLDELVLYVESDKLFLLINQ